MTIKCIKYVEKVDHLNNNNIKWKGRFFKEGTNQKKYYVQGLCVKVKTSLAEFILKLLQWYPTNFGNGVTIVSSLFKIIFYSRGIWG